MLRTISQVNGKMHRWLVTIALGVCAATGSSFAEDVGSGDVPGAASLHRLIDETEALLRDNPENYQAQILLSLTYARAGDFEQSAREAAHAYRNAQGSDQKFHAAKLAAGAHYQAQHYTRAQLWLRRASNHAPSPDAARSVADDFDNVRRANPLKAKLSFSVAPSSNINGGAEDEYFYLGDFKFLLAPSSQALSGIEYAAQVDLSYRLSSGPRHSTTLGFYTYGRTYSLSQSTKAEVPELSGHDYALSLAEVSLDHRQIFASGWGASGASLHLGHVWYGGDPLRDYVGLSLSQEIPVTNRSTAKLRGYVEQQTSFDRVQPDATVLSLKGSYLWRRRNQDIFQVSLETRQNNATIDTYTYVENSLSLGYQLARPIFDTRLQVSLDLGQREYDEFSLSLNGRRDEFASLSATATFERLSYFGFAPSLSLTATKTHSNVDRFNSSGVRGVLGIKSVF